MKRLIIKIDDNEYNEIKNFAIKMKMKRSAVIRKIIELGIRQLKRNEAFKKIKLKEWTIWKAAEYCNESYRSFLRLLKNENIFFPLSRKKMKQEPREIVNYNI